MKDYVMLVETNPVAGREDEYNDWYQHIHLPEVLALKGFKAAGRYRRVTEGGAYHYLAIYAVAAQCPEAILAALDAAVPRMNMSAAIDLDELALTIFEATGPLVAPQAA